MSDGDRIPALYEAFNARDVDGMWAEIDPHVEPTQTDERADGTVAVRVHQAVRDLAGNKIADNEVVHVYRFEHGLVVEMRIEEA